MGDASRPRECPYPPNVNQPNLDCTHDKSRYFAPTEFNNCFIIRSPRFFFNEYSREAKRSAIFTQERSQEGENRGFFYAWAECLQPNTSRTQLDDFAHEQTIIWRQSFAGQVIGSRPVKRKKNSLWIIIDFHLGLNISLSIIAVLSNSLVLVALQRWFALFVRGQKLLFRSLAVRDLLVGFILHPVHVYRSYFGL